MSDRIEYAIGWVLPGLEDFELRFTIRGSPVTLKNSKVIASISRPCGKCKKSPMRTIVSHKNVRAWMKEADKQLRQQWTFTKPIPEAITMNAAIVTYMQTRRKADASNLYQAPEDALQAAGVITDDYQIRTHNGSDRRYDKNDPRVEITLTPARKN